MEQSPPEKGSLAYQERMTALIRMVFGDDIQIIDETEPHRPAEQTLTEPEQLVS